MPQLTLVPFTDLGHTDEVAMRLKIEDVGSPLGRLEVKVTLEVKRRHGRFTTLVSSTYRDRQLDLLSSEVGDWVAALLWGEPGDLHRAAIGATRRMRRYGRGDAG